MAEKIIDVEEAKNEINSLEDTAENRMMERGELIMEDWLTEIEYERYRELKDIINE